MAGYDDLPDWAKLLAAERHVQALVSGAVLVGGTAAALHAAHRQSLDGDHIVMDLRDSDLPGIGLHTYKGLREPWCSWSHVASRGRDWAPVVARLVLDKEGPSP